MTRKRLKKVYTTAVSLLFVLCVAYFAFLPPTSAWFYVNLYEGDKTFIFGTLDFEVPVEYFDPQSIDLPAATKLEDPGEAVAFNEALHIETISATNEGTLPARVYLTVTGDRGTPVSLHWFMFTDEDYDAAADEIDTDREASLMDVIRTRKNMFTGLEANIITDYDASATYTALEAFNFGDGIAGVSDEGHYVVIPPKQPTNIYIAFWADYNETGGALSDTTDVDVHYTYDVDIKLSAGQDSDGWFIRA